MIIFLRTLVLFWVGATDMGNTAGNFYWEDGRKVDVAWWDYTLGQPDNYGSGKKTCVYLNTYQLNKLFDRECHYSYHYICKVGVKYSDCQWN
jgi:hypothetical protein